VVRALWKNYEAQKLKFGNTMLFVRLYYSRICDVRNEKIVVIRSFIAYLSWRATHTRARARDEVSSVMNNSRMNYSQISEICQKLLILLNLSFINDKSPRCARIRALALFVIIMATLRVISISYEKIARNAR